LTVFRQLAIFTWVIRTFRNRALRRYFETGDARGLSVQNIGRIGRMLRALDAASRPEHVNLPGYSFHALRGAPRWSIRVTGNWRITFGWDGTDAVEVDLEDYH
jgi:proteic killer suppression protein